MNMVVISETKWFGEVVYLVDGCIVVHSGRPVSAAGGMGQNMVWVLVLFFILKRFSIAEADWHEIDNV